MRKTPDVAADVSAIAKLSREELSAHWERAYGTVLSAGIRTELLRRSAAWHCQARCLGGFTAETNRLLRAAMRDVEAKTSSGQGQPADQPDLPVSRGTSVAASEVSVSRRGKGERRKLAPGARLLREWNGRTHVVDVVESGFVFEAKVYRSLTAIARTITGTHWSGPRFFGL